MKDKNPHEKYPMVYIEWEDSAESVGWTALRVIRKNKDLTCYSIGWMIEETPDSKIVVPHLTFWEGDGEDGSGAMTIPNSAIRKVVQLFTDSGRKGSDAQHEST